jgi:hypothetical protein
LTCQGSGQECNGDEDDDYEEEGALREGAPPSPHHVFHDDCSDDGGSSRSWSCGPTRTRTDNGSALASSSRSSRASVRGVRMFILPAGLCHDQSRWNNSHPRRATRSSAHHRRYRSAMSAVGLGRQVGDDPGRRVQQRQPISTDARIPRQLWLSRTAARSYFVTDRFR